MRQLNDTALALSSSSCSFCPFILRGIVDLAGWRDLKKGVVIRVTPKLFSKYGIQAVDVALLV